jgi:hypothetical protein
MRDHTIESEPAATTTTTTTTSKTKTKKLKDKRKGKRKERKRDTRSQAKAKARRKIEAAEKASEERRELLPQEIVARMYERRNTCVRPECEQQFWGKGRVVWKFPLYLRTSRSSTSLPPPSSPSASSSPTTTAAMTPTPETNALASASLLSILSPAASPPGFGSVEEMIERYLVYFEEERTEDGGTATEGGDAHASSDAAQQRDQDGRDPNDTGQGALDANGNAGPARPDEPTQDSTPLSPPEGKVVWRKLILPFCSAHCSQVTTSNVA